MRLAGPTPDASPWLLTSGSAPTSRLDGVDVTDALTREDDRVAGYRKATRWTGLAEPFALEIDVPAGAQALTLTGSLNFPNSSSLYAAAQAGVSAQPPRLEARDGAAWRELTADCGLPAGFHKDVVIDLSRHALRGATTLRITTNLQVSWDRAATWGGAEHVSSSSETELPLLRAEKAKTGIPAEVKGPENRWRTFPHDTLDPLPRWRLQSGTVTPDGDVRSELREHDDLLAFVRPGEEITLGWSLAALAPPADGMTRDLILITRGWVKDADPHTAFSDSVLPLPRAGSETYP